MPLLSALVRGYLRSRMRGQTRLTLFLAERFPDVRLVPVEIRGARPLYLDLSDASNHGFFRDAPHAEPPIEKSEAVVLEKVVRAGDVVWDIGANRGFHTVRLASHVGRSGKVVAVEPNPALLPALRRTIAETPWATLVEGALSDAVGEADLFVGTNHEMGSLGDWVPSRLGEQTRRVPTQLYTLDRLIADGFPRPDVVKIDVEGNELRVLEGARATLDRPDAPVLLYESNVYAAPPATGRPATAATEFLQGLSHPQYRFWYLWGWGLVTPLEAGQLVHGNLLALPAARVERWPELLERPFLDSFQELPNPSSSVGASSSALE